MAKRTRSAVKKHRQSLKRRIRNVHVRSHLKTLIKEVNVAIEAKDLTKSREALRVVEAALHKAASKGIIHKRSAARYISRLSKKVYALSKEIAA
jgi:small subunit ribosomal protein S20